MVAAVTRCWGSPCLRTKVTVSVVPVEGDQLMLNDDPTEILEGRVVKENGFWADANEARVARRRAEYCILSTVDCWWNECDIT